MKVLGKQYRTIWREDDSRGIRVIDQRHLPHEFVIEDLHTVESVVAAIRDMHVRGAPLIGATAAYGVYFALLEAGDRNRGSRIQDSVTALLAARPTAVNLAWAVRRVLKAAVEQKGAEAQQEVALQEADRIVEEEVDRCRQIGEHGVEILEALAREGRSPVQILTHCNAGWLACVDYGTATAPIYEAFNRGLDVHVWVDETRPRNQGARLTAWELGQHGVPHTVIADNTGGHLMQRGEVDLVIVGSDRTTSAGDVVNKIGTYLKALAASDNDVPFYVALPSSSIDWSLRDGKDVPIEERSADEVRTIQGLSEDRITEVLLTPDFSPARNVAFDVTPARLVTGLITERGICAASDEGLREMFSDLSE
jgi:methylthioribose-1-phosphate isomerase